MTPRVNPLRRDRVFGWTERERPGMASGEDADSARPPRTPRPTGAGWLGTLALALAAVTSTATVAPAQSADGPPAERTIVATLNAEPGFTVLARAIAVAGLTQELSDAREVTLFAPTDEAFGRLAGGRLDALMRDPAELRRVLAYHVLPGGIEKREKFGMNLRRVTTLEGAPLAIEVRDGRIHAGDAWVTRHDIRARNGVIHAIDRVLTPPARTAAEHRIRTP